jgi:hypothetical protein
MSDTDDTDAEAIADSILAKVAFEAEAARLARLLLSQENAEADAKAAVHLKAATKKLISGEALTRDERLAVIATLLFVTEQNVQINAAYTAAVEVAAATQRKLYQISQAVNGNRQN